MEDARKDLEVFHQSPPTVAVKPSSGFDVGVIYDLSGPFAAAGSVDHDAVVDRDLSTESDPPRLSPPAPPPPPAAKPNNDDWEEF